MEGTGYSAGARKACREALDGEITEYKTFDEGKETGARAADYSERDSSLRIM